MQQQGTKPGDPYGLLDPDPKKKPRVDDPYGLLGPEPATASQGPLPDTGDIDLGSGGDRPPAAKPDAGREPSIWSRDLAPAVGSAVGRAKHSIGSFLDREIAGNAYQRDVIPRIERPAGPAPVPHQMATVTTEADPSKVRQHLDHLDPITQVLANTQAGVDTPAPGQELPFDESTYQEYRKRGFEEYNAPGTTPERKAEVARMLGQLEKQRSEAIALRKEDPLSAAGRTATFGALATPERYAIRREHERDIAEGRNVDPSELRANNIIREGERPHAVEPGATAGQDIGELAGSIIPFEAGERGAMYGVRKLAEGLDRLPAARNIAEALRFAESPVTATTEFGQYGQTLAKRAIRGQAGFATLQAGEAIKHDQPVGEAVAKGVVPGIVMGTLLGGVGDVLGGNVPMGSEYDHLIPGAYIAEASHMIDATRPDKLPIMDKMPDAQRKAALSTIGSGLDAVLEQKKESAYQPIVRRTETSEERYGSEATSFDNRARQRRWTDWNNETPHEPPPRRVWSQEERDAFHAEQVAKQGPYSGLPAPLHPNEAEELFRRGATEKFPYQLREEEAARQAAAAPERPPINADNFDMSKQMEAIKAREAEQAALAEQARVVAQQTPPGAEAPPATPEERLARARAKFAEHVKSGDIPKIAFAATAVAAAKEADTNDSKGAALLAGVAALGLNRVDAEELFARYEKGASTTTLAKDYGLTRPQVREIAASMGDLRESTKEGTPPRETERDKSPYLDQKPPVGKRTLREILRSADLKGTPASQMRKALRMLGEHEAADQVKVVAGKLVIPAALLTAAVNTDDPQTKKALSVLGLALTTERLHSGEEFYSRISKSVRELPKQWGELKGANEWLQKLGADKSFSKEEFDRVLRPALEKSRDAKQKLTRNDILKIIDANRLQIDTERMTEGGRDLTTGAPHAEEPPRVRDQGETLPDGARPNEGPRAIELLEERARQVSEAEEEVSRAESHESAMLRDLESAWNDMGGNEARLHRILERSDEGEGIDVSDAMSRLQDEYNENPPDGYNSPALTDDSYRTRQNGDLSQIVRRGTNEVVASEATDMEALAVYAHKYGDNGTGNLSDYLGPGSDYAVIENEDGDFEIVDSDDHSNVHAANSDRDDLVNEWVQDNYQPNEDLVDWSHLRSELEYYANAHQEYREVESNTYDLREGSMDDDSDFKRRLDDARLEDDQERVEEDARQGRLLDHDPEFYELDEAQRDYVRRGIERGAVGTTMPLDAGARNMPGELNYDPERQYYGQRTMPRNRPAYVYDASLPHTPFPREGHAPVEPDPDQLDVFAAPPSSLGDPKKVVSLPVRQQIIALLKSTGVTKFTNYQRVPGGKNYREMLLQWANKPRPKNFPKHSVWQGEDGLWRIKTPDGVKLRSEFDTQEEALEEAHTLDGSPGDYEAGHWDAPNVVGHIRMTEHFYSGAGNIEHPLMRDLIEQRTELGRKQGDIARRYASMEAMNTGREATPEMHDLAQEYAAINRDVEAVQDQYEEAKRQNLDRGYKERVLNAFEHQSDWKQQGEREGFRTEGDEGEREAGLTAALVEAQRRMNEFQSTLDAERDAAQAKVFADLASMEMGIRTATTGPELAKEYEKISAQSSSTLSKAENEWWEMVDARLHVANRVFNEQERTLGRAVDAAQHALDHRRQGVPDMPWKDPDQVFGLTAAKMLLESAEGDYDRVAWSTAENRYSLAGLSLDAAKITYDQSVTGAVKRLLKGLGFKDAKVEKITMDGYEHWSVKLTPEMKKAMKEKGFPILSALALLSAPSTLKAEDGSEDKRSVVPYLIAAGLAAGAWKMIPREMRARLAARVKAEGIERAKTQKDEPRTYEAVKILRRATGAAAVTAAAAIVSGSDEKELSNMTIPLSALAVLSAIGSENLAGARDAIGGKFVEQLRKTRQGADAVRFFNPDALLSPEVRRAVLDYEKGRGKGKARAAELSGKAEALGPSGDRAVSDVIEKEDTEDISNMKPEDVEAVLTVAAEVAKEFESLTQQKVKLGVLKPHEAIPDYMPRKYAYWEALDIMAENPRPVSIKPGQRPRIAGSKPRTIEKGDIEARTKLGEIREASYRTATGIEEGYADVAAAQLFKTLRATPGVIHPEYLSAINDFLTAKDMLRQAKLAKNAADISTAEGLLDKAMLESKRISDRFRMKGGDYVTLSGSRGFGVLRDAVVQRDVANSLNGIPEIKRIDKFMQFWKQAKTVFNPGTHLANILSNVVTLHMAGIRMTEQPLWLVKAARDMRQYGPGTRALAEAGYLDQNVVTAGSGGMGETARTAKSEAGLQKLKETTRPATAQVLGEQGIGEHVDHTPTFRAIGKAVKQTYNNEDNIFRVALYLKATAHPDPFALLEGSGFGMGPETALKHVKGAYGDFRTRSPALRVTRGSLAPFILYSAKAVPAFAKQIVDHPVRYMTLIATWGALDQYAKSQVGDVPDTDIEERDRREFGYFFPGFVQLPFTNAKGDKAMEDLSRWTPMSGVTDVAQPGVTASQFSSKWPRILTPSGPATDIYSKFSGNIDTQSGQRRYSIEKPLKRNIGQALEDAGDLVLPSALGFHRRRLLEDFDNKDFDALKTDLPGLAGLRPRYIRPGSVAMGAGISMQKALDDAHAEARRALMKSQSDDQNEKIIKQYIEYVDQITHNFQNRVSPENDR
jgi:hypothetical protein